MRNDAFFPSLGGHDGVRSYKELLELDDPGVKTISSIFSSSYKGSTGLVFQDRQNTSKIPFLSHPWQHCFWVAFILLIFLSTKPAFSKNPASWPSLLENTSLQRKLSVQDSALHLMVVVCPWGVCQVQMGSLVGWAYTTKSENQGGSESRLMYQLCLQIGFSPFGDVRAATFETSHATVRLRE